MIFLLNKRSLKIRYRSLLDAPARLTALTIPIFAIILLLRLTARYHDVGIDYITHLTLFILGPIFTAYPLASFIAISTTAYDAAIKKATRESPVRFVQKPDLIAPIAITIASVLIQARSFLAYSSVLGPLSGTYSNYFLVSTALLVLYGAMRY